MVDIDVRGVNQGQKEYAKTELEQLFSRFKNLEIIITRDFDNVVQEYLRKREITEPYESTRAGGEVVACKVMHYPLNSQLATCLVINGNYEIFSDWKGGWAKIERLFCLLHEREHILLDQDRYRLIGHNNFFSNPASTAECMSELAHDISSEYIAERNAIAILQDASEGDLSSYFSDRARGMTSVLSSHLDSFQPFLTEKIDRFRQKRITIDDFWGSIYLRTRDILNALALVTAFAHAIPSVSPEFDSIKLSTTFKRLFEDDWSQVEPVIVLMYGDRSDYEKKMRNITASFQNLFQRFGIELRDTPRGMAVYLSA